MEDKRAINIILRYFAYFMVCVYIGMSFFVFFGDDWGYNFNISKEWRLFISIFFFFYGIFRLAMILIKRRNHE